MELIEFLDKGITMYHAVKTAEELLSDNGFKKLRIDESWSLENFGKYYLIINDSTIIAFKVGKDEKSGFKIIGAHTDSPGFKLKPNGLVKSNGFYKLNTEVYGGPILETWFDRPLSLAGRVYLRSQKTYEPEFRLVNFDRDLLTIANLAIHMTRGNEEDKINPQIHTLPILGLGDGEVDVEEMISKELNVHKADILSYDIFIYSREKAGKIGLNGEFVSSGKIDNLGMVHAGLTALLNSQENDNNQVFVAFDNEEIGSGTLQGAASSMFKDVLKKIHYALGGNEEEFINRIYKSFMISADQAHSVHPNYSEKADITNIPIINRGPVIKESARKSYATDAYSKAVLIDIFKKKNIPYQTYLNRSDIRGGSTIGSIIETGTGIRNIDIGNALLGMHSVRELAGLKDQEYMIDFMKAFYEV